MPVRSVLDKTVKRFCTVAECNRDLYATGWCSRHYDRMRHYGRLDLLERVIPLCSVADCESVAKSNSYCTKHHYHWRRYGDPLRAVRTQVAKGFYPECIIEGCNSSPHGRGLCDAHYKLDERRRKPEYSVWLDIKRRCYNPNWKQYADWGGRGIKVCERWRQSFVDFLADMGHRPSNEYSIERLDVNGDYEPSNCVWATALVQANNKRNNRLFSYGGETLTIAQWSRRVGIRHALVNSRLSRGWPEEKALNLTGVQ